MIRAYQYNGIPFNKIAKTKKSAQKLVKSLNIFTAVIKDGYTATIEKDSFLADISLKFLGIDTCKYEKGELVDLLPEKEQFDYKGLPAILKIPSRFVSVKDKEGLLFWGNERFLIRGNCPVTPEHLNFDFSRLLLNGERKQYNNLWLTTCIYKDSTEHKIVYYGNFEDKLFFDQKYLKFIEQNTKGKLSLVCSMNDGMPCLNVYSGEKLVFILAGLDLSRDEFIGDKIIYKPRRGA